METRSKKLVTMAIKIMQDKDRNVLDRLTNPAYAYESTKGTTKLEQLKALAGYKALFEKPTAIVSPVSRRDELSEEELEDPFSDSGSEYVPSNNSIISKTSESETENEVRFFELGQTQTAQASTTTEINMELQSTSKSSLPLTDSETSNETCSKSQGVNIAAAQKHNGKIVRDKEHSCYFCHKIVVNNLARHIEVKHGKEMEVTKILAKPKNSKGRRIAFLNISRCGDFYHNCDVLSMKKGDLILSRRPSLNEAKCASYFDYGPCPECLGFMLKKHIWRHLKYSCASKISESGKEILQNKKNPIAESSALLNGILGTDISSEFINNIINKFKNDDISQTCKEDTTILKFGAFLYEKYSASQSELIRQSMRQLGRLQIVLSENDSNLTALKLSLLPEKFDIIVNSVRELCVSTREISKRPEFKTPSLALKLGYALRKCVAIERGQALRRGDLKKNDQLLSFLTLLDLEWSVRISSNALTTMYSRKKTAVDLLPVTSDLVKLSNFLDKEIKLVLSNLDKSQSSVLWTKLASLTLSRIILFNKRRSGEAAKMTIQQYSTRPDWNKTGTQEMKDSLTPFENKLAEKLTIIRIIGKRGRIVPVILTKEMKEAIDKLILNRVKCGILIENPYIFAIINRDASHMRGHDCIKKWCIEAELQSPQLVTSTKLRKYVATVCQIFNLSENECDWLARHLGHDIRVHREFYRLQENAVELTKVSRLLLAVDQGEASNFTGKELKE